MGQRMDKGGSSKPCFQKQYYLPQHREHEFSSPFFIIIDAKEMVVTDSILLHSNEEYRDDTYIPMLKLGTTEYS